jgi:hypothetical protein
MTPCQISTIATPKNYTPSSDFPIVRYHEMGFLVSSKYGFQLYGFLISSALAELLGEHLNILSVAMLSYSTAFTDARRVNRIHCRAKKYC